MIDFYTSATANGQKVALMLEETGLSYRQHEVSLLAGEHRAEPFLSINPIGQIPAILDQDGPGGTPLALGQSLAIVRYLADKSGQFLPTDARARAQADLYMALVSADVGASFSGIFMFGTLPAMRGQQPIDAAVSYYTSQATRFLTVLDERLAEAEYLDGNGYSIADILTYPVAVSSVRSLGDAPLANYPNILRWRDAIAERPAVQRVFG